jgi:hypothetical protein
LPDAFGTIKLPERQINVSSYNAGLGWQLSFSKLYRPRDNVYDQRDYTETSEWVYMAPDGSEHIFYHTLHEDNAAGSFSFWYTRDHGGKRP